MATDAYFAIDYGKHRQKTLNETEIKSKNQVAKCYSIGNKHGKGAGLVNPTEFTSAARTQGGPRQKNQSSSNRPIIDFSKSQGSDVVTKSLHSIDRGGGKFAGTTAGGSRKCTRLTGSKIAQLVKPKQEVGPNDEEDGLVHHYTEEITPNFKLEGEDTFFYMNDAKIRQPAQTQMAKAH